LRSELPNILATRSDVLSPRMMRIIEALAGGDWHRLDQRIESLSSEIEALARQDPACQRLMTVPGIGPIVASAMVAAIGVLTGGTANLKWEIDQAAALLSRQRLIFVVPPTSDAKALERDIAQRFGEPELLPPEPRSSLLQWVARLFNPHVQGKIIYFGADGRPCAALMPYALSPESLFLAPYRPYRDTLNAACRRVFKELGLDEPQEPDRRSPAGVLRRRLRPAPVLPR
jgi:hypothetical protein